MSPVPVLYVIPRMSIGGAQRHLVEVLRRLDRQRFEPLLCCLATNRDALDLLDEVKALGVPVLDAGLRDASNALARPHTLRQVVRIAAELRRRRVQVVHSYLFHANWFGTLAGRLAGVPVVIVSKRSMDVYPRARERWACRLTNRLAHRVTAVAEAVREHVHREEGCPLEKVVVIPNGVNTEQFREPSTATAAELLGSSENGTMVVGTITRLVWKRGHEQLLEAAALVARGEPTARLLVVGDGPLRPTLEQKVKEQGLNATVRFLGAVPRAARLLPHFNVFVLSSVWEGMSNGLLEAMAAGRPVVATRVGGNPEVVVDGVSGLLVPPRDPQAMADAVLRLLREPELARRMGEAASRRVEKEFSLPRMVHRMESLYDEMLPPRAA